MEHMKVIDVTKCVWPRYPVHTSQCNYSKPNFVLNLTHSFEIGTINNPHIRLTPFESCQNARFLIRVIESVSFQTPQWVTVHVEDASISIDTTLITSVGSYELNFQAQLISFSVSREYLDYSTSIIESTFEFLNTNCEIGGYVTKQYLVAKQLETFSILFSDSELDNVNLRIDLHDSISSFITFDSDAFAAELKLMANAVSDDSTDLVVWYTDKYHQDDQFWRNITLQLYLFESEPPVFDSELPNITIDRCESVKFELPTFHDPDTPLSK